MEFETACIYRMREILLDLSTTLGDALRNARNPTSASAMQPRQEVSAWAVDLVEHLRTFSDIVDERMKIKLSKKREREEYLRASASGLDKVQPRILNVKAALKKERSEHERKVVDISAEIDVEHSLLESMKTSHATEIMRQMNKSKNEIQKVQEETDAATEILQADIQSYEERFADGLKTKHLSEERELYRKRSKVKAEYLAALAKYDRDVGDLHHTMENLTDELHQVDEELTNFRHELAVQNVQYVELKKERELALLKAFTEDLDNFCKNRAAKIIQRFWRSYYERWCMRRKRKSKKKK